MGFALLLGFVLVGIVLNFPFGRTARNLQAQRWLIEVLELIAADLPGLDQPRPEAEEQGVVLEVYVDEGILTEAIVEHTATTIANLPPPNIRWPGYESVSRATPGADVLVVRSSSGPLTLGVHVEYESVRTKGNVTRFVSVRQLFLEPWTLIQLLGSAAIATLLWMGYVGGFRRKQQADYDHYERDREHKLITAREHLELALELHRDDKLLRAIREAKTAIEHYPELSEARSFHDTLVSELAARTHAPAEQARERAEPGHEPAHQAEQAHDKAEPDTKPAHHAEQAQFGPEPAHHGKQAQDLFLRVVGTSFAYRGSKTTHRIRVGRQRENADGVATNDFVIRVPTDDYMSLRISREHFVIERYGDECFITDLSRGGTKLRGEKLTPKRPRRIESGDHITIADVLVIEFLIREIAHPAILAHRHEMALPNVGAMKFEATIGNLTTLE